MVLICNNTILTIEQFHKNRCMEKQSVRDIHTQLKYGTDEFKMIPKEEPKPNTTFLSSNEGHQSMKSIYSIQLSKYNCTRK